MKKRKWVLLALAAAMISLSWGTVQVRREPNRRGTDDQSLSARQEKVMRSRVTAEQRQAAAARFKQLRQTQLSKSLASGAKMSIMAAPAPDPGGIPHYFGPYPNYANSPLPAGGVGPITVVSPGAGYTSPTVVITDVYGVGTGASAVAAVNPTTMGIDSVTVTSPGTNYYAPLVLIADPTGTGADATAELVGPFTGGLHKFVDRVAGIDPADPNGLGQYIPVGVPDTSAYPGSDYYEIELGQFSEQLHSDMEPTLLRGYRQTNTSDPAVSAFHYLGPLIVAQRDRPVRIKFTNNLPTGVGGNLFIPVDTTLMGAGEGPLVGENYTENRAAVHLHGGFTSWISDGTPHQWVAPAGETTNYKRGLSVFNVPDMPDPGDGSLTLFYGNEQSARLMFYHDHALGLTRLNVYAGEAAGYVITDAVEQDLINGTNTTGVNPALQKVLPGVGFPLIIQDKSFVDPATIYAQDPTWNWGATPGTPILGDLWMPHVYMPNQNPYDLGGMNAFGRWHYGPWFWPPTSEIAFPPIPNPYFGDDPWEPPTMPATPNPSMAMEAFMDTPLINGTVYPYMEVEPKAYRFRVLNACNDRFVNLQLYKADPTILTADGAALNTEVRMVPAVINPAFPPDWPIDGRQGGVPDPTMVGPSFIQIGTEGGFLPAPVLIHNQPVDWNLDPTTFNMGLVSKYAVLLGPAERADVIVDFSAFAGQTLILYNDAPAAFPALDQRYDYYTYNPSHTDAGGTPSTLPGYGPNTRTMMQIRVTKPLTTPFQVSLPTLEAAFAKSGTKRGVFEASQDPILIPTDAYNTAYDGSFSADPYVRIFDYAKTFQTLAGDTVTIPFEPKAIQDEMGEAFDVEYGRMSGFLGVQLPASIWQQKFTQYPYATPPVEIVTDTMTPLSPVQDDGTQIWKFTHNGVDTHTIHFHLMNVQLLNRVAWDNAVSLPDANELGWKETVRINPLEDTIVALRPYAPKLPFDVPNSFRPIDVTKPIGAILMGGPGGFKDPLGVPVTIVNHLVNWGWEYVLHCHLLGHEEMDMMHGMAFAVVPRTPSGLVGVRAPDGTNVDLTWLDNSANETGFTVQRATDLGFTTNLNEVSFGFDVTNFVDTGLDPASTYFWRVIADNQVGDNQTPGFPVVSVSSTPSNAVGYGPGGAVTLTLTLPNGGESWLAGSTQNVTWTQVGLTGLATIDLYKGGAFLKNLGTADVTLGTFAWTIDAAEAAGIDYRIRVSQGGMFDDSNADFTIVRAALRTDFNGDGQDDILWRYYGAGGANLIWFLGNTPGAPQPLQSATQMAAPLSASQSAAARTLNKGAAALRNLAGRNPKDKPATVSSQDLMTVKNERGARVRAVNDPRRAGMPTGILRSPAAYADPRQVKSSESQAPAGAFAELAAAVYLGSGDVMPVPDLSWEIKGTGDFNKDGQVDILWHYNGPGGFNVVWFMNGASWTGSVELVPVDDSTWQIVGTGDFNRDGNIDILWRNTVSGANVVWFMNGTNWVSSAALLGVSDPNWTIVGTGDFNLDGDVDILWRLNGAGGLNTIWYLHGLTWSSSADMPSVSDLNWQIVGTGDYNNDGSADVLWRYNGAGGFNVIWYLTGANWIGSESLLAVPDLNWKIVGR